MAFALAHRARGELVDALVDDDSFASIAEQRPAACVDAPHAHSSPDRSGVAVDIELSEMDELGADMDMHALLHDM